MGKDILVAGLKMYLNRSAAPLQPLPDEGTDLCSGRLELWRVGWRVRVHIGTVCCPCNIKIE